MAKQTNRIEPGYDRGYRKAIQDINHFLESNGLINDNVQTIIKVNKMSQLKKVLKDSLNILLVNYKSREEFKKLGGGVQFCCTVNEKHNFDKNSKVFLFPKYEITERVKEK